MNYSIKKTGFAAIAFAVAMTPAVAFAKPAAAPSENAAPPKVEANQAAQCELNAVLASKQGDGSIPKNLEFMRSWLTGPLYSHYKSFVLLDKKSMSLRGKGPQEVRLTTGNTLKLRLLGVSKEKLKLKLELSTRTGADKKLVTTDYTIPDNALFFVQGGEYKSGDVTGALVLTVQCARKKQRSG